MEYICEKEKYGLVEFHDKYQDKLPLLIKVVQGYHGDIAEDVFDRDQIIRVQTIASQKRVVARFKIAAHEERLFSIPTTYYEPFCVVRYNKSKEELYINEIIGKSKFPIIVRVPKNHTITVGNKKCSANDIPNIELLEVFEQMSLLGNFVDDGELADGLLPVPLYLSQLMVSIVTGVKGYTEQRWRQFLEDLERSSFSNEYDMGFGNQNIAEYDPNAFHSTSTYALMEPRTYSNIAGLVKNSGVHSLAKDKGVKTDHKAHPKDSKNTKQPTGGAPVNTNQDDVYEEIDNTPRDGAHAYYEELQTSLSSGSGPPRGGVQKAQKNHHAYKGAPPVVPKKPTKISNQPSNPSEAPALPVRAAKPPSHHPQENVSHNYDNDVPRTTIKPTIQRQPSITPSQSLKPIEKSNQTTDPAGALGNPEKVSSKEDMVKQIKSQNGGSALSDLPKVNNKDDVAKLTIDDVIGYVYKLGLGQYAEAFKEQMIDGPLLIELDKDILKEDFGMKGVEALKILKFAKEGHVPQYSSNS